MNANQRSARNAYAGAGLDRAHLRRNDSRWLAAAREDPGSRFVLALPSNKVWATPAGDALQWLHAAQLGAVRRAHASLLGIDDSGTAYFLAKSESPPATPGQVQSLRAMASAGDAFHAGLAAYATALAHWQRHSRYCPACGNTTTHDEAGHRAHCTQCGLAQFPRTDPAVIVLVEHDDAVLLGRKPEWPDGRFSTLAGFVEPGEALEDAVRREIAEEAGVRVVACDYHSSQPWPFPASLMLGFFARADSRALAGGDGELAEARWFTHTALRTGLADGSLSLPPAYSVAYHLINDWLASARP